MRRNSRLKEEKMEISKNTQGKNRRMSRGLHLTYIVSVFIFVVGGALSIPFVYESQTLWYKIGIDKTLLRAGKIAGLLAAILLLVQILLAVRGETLEELFGVRSLISWHRVNGVFILILALTHVTLVLVPEGIGNLPIGMKYWPEMVGAAMLLIIFTMVVSSQLRQRLGFNYTRWRAFHKLLGYMALALIGVHILFVSESFEHVVPRTALVITVASIVIVLFQIKRAAFKKKR
jgi:predicted ferric reductase